jgi:hypothetical protein
VLLLPQPLGVPPCLPLALSKLPFFFFFSLLVELGFELSICKAVLYSLSHTSSPKIAIYFYFYCLSLLGVLEINENM